MRTKKAYFDMPLGTSKKFMTLDLLDLMIPK